MKRDGLFEGGRWVESRDNDELRLELQPDGHQERKDVTTAGRWHTRGERDEGDTEEREELSLAAHAFPEQYTATTGLPPGTVSISNASALLKLPPAEGPRGSLSRFTNGTDACAQLEGTPSKQPSRRRS